MNSNLRYYCMKYASDVTKTKTGLYINQNNYENMVSQAYEGKLAEFAAHDWLRDVIGMKPDALPELDVLKRPNWNSDLSSGKYRFSVKCCLERWAGTKHDYSWTFQDGRTRKDPIIKSVDPFYVVVFVRTMALNRGDEDEFMIYGTASAKDLNQSNAFIFEDGIDVPSMKGEKKFVKAEKTNAIQINGDLITLY